MWKLIILIACLCYHCACGPVGFKRNMAIMQRDNEPMIRETSASNEAETPTYEMETHKPHISSRPAMVQKPASDMMLMSTLTLPSNATSIRTEIVDGFSCADKPYGYYADIENDCQIFHVCLPVTYADNRENTFRWSFICPEETIFSQDSFTCMRREDMAIDCMESFKYYDLNRNFGMMNDENSNNKEVHESIQTNSPSTASSSSIQPASNKAPQKVELPSKPINMPMTDDQEMSSSLSSPSSSTSTAMKVPQQQPQNTANPIESEKSENKAPNKAPKPNRRKPSVKPAAMNEKNKIGVFNTPPSRKATPTTAVNLEILTTTTRPTYEKQNEAITTSGSKLTKRPLYNFSSSNKDRPHPVKTATNTKITTITMNKAEAAPTRFDLFNPNRRRPVESTTIRKDETATELQPTSTSTDIVQEEADETKDAQPEASETIPVYVPLPQASVPEQHDDKEKIEIPITKPIETMKPEMEKSPENVKTTESVSLPLEAIEEIPAVLIEREEENQKPTILPSESENKDNKDTDKIETPQEQPETPNVPETLTTTAMETETSAVATPENIEVSSEMMLPDPMVQEAHKQSMGGFKPVDPAMAAEAEALIADFLNTLMKSEMSQSKPQPHDETMKPMQPETDEIKENQNSNSSNEQLETIKQENQPSTDPTVAQEDSSDVVVPEITTNANQPQQVIVEQPSTDSNINEMMSVMQLFPDQMQHIPVRIIQSPIDEMIQEDSGPQFTKLSPNEVPAPNKISGNKPISVEDIVELVKERLDQTPTTSIDTQKLSVGDAIVNVAPGSPDIASSPSEVSVMNSETKVPAYDEVLPIYNRVISNINQNMAMAHLAEDAANSELKTDLKNTNKSAANLEQTDEVTIAAGTTAASETSAAKSNRSLRSRSLKNSTREKMDARKRQFLFKSDANLKLKH